MAAPEQEAKDTSQKIDLSTLPKDSNVHIHVGTEQPEFKGSRIEAEYSKRSLVSIITGAIGAVLGGFGTASYINDKMFDFKTEVLDKTKNNILGRSGIGAGLVEGGAALGGGGLAGALGSGEIHASNAQTLAKSGKYGALPKFIYKLPGGETTLVLAGAAAVGTVAAAVAYNVVGPDKKKPEEDKNKDWADKVATDKDQPRILS